MSKDKYVGADVHAASTTFAVRDASGKLITESTVETGTKPLLAFLDRIPGTVHLTFEEGTYAAWLYDLLQPRVAELVVCNPRRNKLLVDGNKSDKVDAGKLAELLRGGFLQPVYHGQRGMRRLKEVARGYEGLVRDSVRVKNSTKAVFRSQGIRTTSAVYKPEARQEWLEKLPANGLRHRAGWLLSQHDFVEALRNEAEDALLKEAKKHRPWKLLQTVPGIGPVRAAQIVAYVDTPFRFRTKRQYWAYVGLAVVTRSSADYRVRYDELQVRRRASTRGLNRNRNPVLKTVYIGAAMQAIRGPFRDHAEQLVSDGMRREMARVTVARKLAAISLAIWKKGEKYDSETALKRTE